MLYVVLLESVDGRIHLREAAPVIMAGKPMFIDKPAAGSLADVIAIYDLAKKRNVPCFSSSSRYAELCREIGRFFKSGNLPVTADETIEIFTFMEAADESKRQGGAPVSLAGVLAKARSEAAERSRN
jgi:hypothetical protein